LFLKDKAAIEVPINVGSPIEPQFVIYPDNTAGAREPAGFMRCQKRIII
jgi:hypothetical protein